MRSGQCQWTSIELVMLSTFTFTVIAHHYSFCFSCGYLAHFQEEEKREKNIQPWCLFLQLFCPSPLAALPDLNDTWIYQDNPVACTQFHLKIGRRDFVYLRVCMRIFRFPLLHGFLLSTPIDNVTTTAIVGSILDNFLTIFTICNSHTVEFYYQMLVLYRHSVLYFVFLLLLPFACSFYYIFTVHECVDTLIMSLMALTLFTYVCFSLS